MSGNLSHNLLDSVDIVEAMKLPKRSMPFILKIGEFNLKTCGRQKTFTAYMQLLEAWRHWFIFLLNAMFST